MFLGVLLPAAVAGPSEHLQRAILNGLAKYDPSIRQAHLEKQSAKGAPQAPVKSAPKSAQTPAIATEGPLLVLPAITVDGKADKISRTLPRLTISSPAKNLPSGPFETPEARRARLVQKHFTELEQLLNRREISWLGMSPEARAANRESIESAARQINDIADSLELAVALGLETEEEQKKLRAELKRLYYDRPR